LAAGAAAESRPTRRQRSRGSSPAGCAGPGGVGPGGSGPGACVGSQPPQLAFDHFFMIREAALAGGGAALLPGFVVAGDLAKGDLVQSGPVWATGAVYAAVGTSTAFGRPVAQAFLDWGGVG